MQDIEQQHSSLLGNRKSYMSLHSMGAASMTDSDRYASIPNLMPMAHRPAIFRSLALWGFNDGA
jgi:hypothetical protein